MSGPDATLRAKGARLVDQLRRDELLAYTEARERCCDFYSSSSTPAEKLGASKPGQEACPKCSGSGLVQCDPLDVARLLAFCGDEEAAEIADWSAESVWDTWHEALLDLAAKLPPKRAVWCESCEPDKDDGSHFRGLCGTDAPAFHDTPAERWLLVVAAEAVARECVHDCPCDLRSGYCTCGLHEIIGALDACRAWIAEPTPERERTWANAALGEAEWVPWPYRPHPDPVATVPVAKPEWALLAAADVLGPDHVREIASRAIREAVRGG